MTWLCLKGLNKLNDSAMDDFDLALAEASEQGSPIWHDIRAGRFTSSKIYRLIKTGERLMTETELANRPKKGKGSTAKYTDDPTKFSPDGQTYIEEKVAEVLTGEAPVEFFSHATAWGDTWEPFAAEHYAKKFNVEFDIISFQPFGEHAGGSPDRKIKGSKRGVEIKCPHNSKNQVNYLLCSDQWDIKRNYPEHYWQCMSNLLFMDWEGIYLVTFDPRMKEEKHKMAVIHILPNAQDMDLICKRLEMAVKEKLEILRSIG